VHIRSFLVHYMLKSGYFSSIVSYRKRTGKRQLLKFHLACVYFIENMCCIYLIENMSCISSVENYIFYLRYRAYVLYLFYRSIYSIEIISFIHSMEDMSCIYSIENLSGTEVICSGSLYIGACNSIYLMFYLRFRSLYLVSL